MDSRSWPVCIFSCCIVGLFPPNKLAQHIARYLERQGRLVRDAENIVNR